jgi:Secretion system C-terminal sorting domain
MKRKFIFLQLLINALPFAVFSQVNQLDPIVDSCANHLNNLSYDTGEVFVIFEIQNEDVIYKETNESTENRIENSSSNKISIYPNPVNNILTILTSDKKEVTRIMLFSMDGRIIMDREIENNQVDLTNLPVGSYILKTNYNETNNFKLIKI